MIANHDRDPPDEFATDELVTAFASVTSQIKSALSDPALRRLLMANRDSLLKACETALAIETVARRDGSLRSGIGADDAEAA